jgi:uncharacterized membrane protein
MGSIEHAIEVDVPVRTAYNQWTQFEEFPRFMKGVEKVVQLDDQRLHWIAEVGGQKREWFSTITEQTPDQRIAWTSDGDFHNAGVVTFHKLSDDRCKVMLQMKYETSGLAEKAAQFLGVIGMQVREDLDRFKEFIEDRGVETGAYRGTIRQTT